MTGTLALGSVHYNEETDGLSVATLELDNLTVSDELRERP